MQKRLCLMLVLLCTMVLGAWADSPFSGGDGSAKNPYIISTTAQWDQFASDVNAGNAYSDKFFLLNADITVSTMVGAGTTGDNAKPFSGTFDGGSHTLTFNHTATEAEGDVAPFRFVKNATICNLHVAGEINTAYKHAGGLAARTYGTTLIQNCRVSTVIKSSVAGDATHGGIVAIKPDWSNAHLTIEGCVFDGKILTTNGTTNCGGFVGYTSYGSLTIKNSIYAPAATVSGENAVSSQMTFYRFNAKHAGAITLTNCYYFKPLGNTQGKKAHSIGFGPGIDITVVPTGTATEYDVSGITGYNGNQCVKYNGTVYAGFEDDVRFKFKHNYVGCTVTSYKVGGNELPGDDTNGYTLSMPDEDVSIALYMNGPAVLNFPQDGTQGDPYPIESAEIWDYIVSQVNFDSDSPYTTAYYILKNDITVTTMMGSANHRFKGHFDGGGKTLTVNYNTDEQYAAPFRYVEGAEISNLRVAGTIKTSTKFAGGFIANAKGNNTLTNCRSSVTIDSSIEGDGTHGGFVANNTGGTLTITGCTFDGSMMGGSTDGCAGFVGWNETKDDANGKVNITNSLFAPTGLLIGLAQTFVRSRSYDDDVITLTNSHCTPAAHYSIDQQSRVYSIIADENVGMTFNGTNPNSYSVSGITFYNAGLTFDDVLYAQEDDQLTLTLTHLGSAPSGYSFSGFASTAGIVTHGEGNSYTLTVGSARATIYAAYTVISTPWSGAGDGSEEHPYEIASSDQWNELVTKVNTGMVNTNNESFATAYYKLTANITVTTMVGTEGYRFKGHFDGGGKTLTLSYGTSDAPFDEDYCAPFRYIQDAEISNLHVDGTIYTQKQFAAGIAGSAFNDNAITDCRSSVTIDSRVSGDGTHGGFVANCRNKASKGIYFTFTRCAFDGKLLGANTTNCGGFMGWVQGYDWSGVKVKNCIFAPSEVSVQTDGCAPFSRGQFYNTVYITVENSYYTQTFGSQQGEMAYAQQPANVMTEALTIAGVTVYVKKTVVTDLVATDITPTTATISWTGTDACSNYQVRYRVKQNPDIYSTSFEDGLPEGWTMFDNDDDEYNWSHNAGMKSGMAYYGVGCMYSASFLNKVGSLEPDNWLVSKRLPLGGTMKVWLKGQDADEYREHFAIYLSTTGGSKSDFLDADGNLQSGVITLVPETETDNIYQEYTADLNAYSGQEGYIAIRHFNCSDEYFLVLDDFSIYNESAGGEWTVASDASSDGTTLTALTPNTPYEYQVGYDYSGNTYYSSIATLTTLAADVAPTDLSVTAITSTTATISWKGFGDTYNLRYGKGGMAKVTLSMPENIWDDGTGYQMLLDADHDTYGSVIPETGGLTISGDASAATYAEFEYKIPENADGALTTSNVVDGTEGKKSVTITIPAGTYDWCITNPSPGDRMWIASNHGNITGRQDDFVFEAGKHYTFTVTYEPTVDNDCVTLTVEDEAALEPGTVTNLTGITTTSRALTGLTASTDYTIYVQSVKGDMTSEWSRVNFTTLEAGKLNLYDDQDNTDIIADAANQGGTWDVTLADRTLWKDGDWNTLCLPFNVTSFTGTPLEGATLKELGNSDACTTGFDATTGTLTLDFVAANQIEAGHAYIVKWETTGDPIENPVFHGVTIINESPADQTVVSKDGTVSFAGTYKATTFAAEDRSILLVGAGNTLYYPKTGASLGAQRASFTLHGITAGDPAPHGIKAIVMNFDEEEPTSICDVTTDHGLQTTDMWYTINGVKLTGKPTTKGVYIHNGRKEVVR